MDEIMTDWERQDLDQFPFSILCDEVEALKASASGDPDSQVDKGSPLWEQIVSLQHRLRMAIEFIGVGTVFDGVEKRFERIDAVLPIRNYSARDLLGQLDSRIVGQTRARFEKALRLFDDGDYESCLQECGKLGEILLGSYRGALPGWESEQRPGQTRNELDQIGRWLATSGVIDPAGFGLASRNRIEWFLLYMFEVLQYFRNIGAHAQADDARLPDWQNRRRQEFIERPEHARLALFRSFQIAIELASVAGHLE
jgi:hypothetical protein